MPKRDIPTNVENLLINNEPFEYAHLVKFERPFNPKDGEFRTGANRYVYLTDGARDISYDGNIYRAHRLQSVGNYSETTVARATNMSLTLSGEDLGLSYTFKGSQSGATLTAATTGLYDGSEEIDFVEAGFREGDKVKIVRTNGQNYSNGDSQRIFIISAFSSNNQVITLAVTGTDTDDSTLETISNQNLTMTLENEELSGATLERGIGASNPLFTNREVFVYKVFFDAEGAEKGAIQVFKGIIASTSISEASTGSRVKWGLTSHWGDFVQVGGRLTLDEVHRSLDSNGKPSIESAIKPSYATDLGFQHAETSLNTIANYKTTETRTLVKTKKRGGLAGLFGGTKTYTVDEQYDVDHQVDLNVHLKGRHLPVVYGVQRVPGIPVFADTKNNNSKEVYVAYALAEGKIQGLYNMYFEGSPIICTDQSDFDVRNAVNGTERAETQLQCYGRADRGDTLSGTALTGSSSTVSDNSDYDWYDDSQEAVRKADAREKAYVGANWTYITVDEDNVNALTSTSNAKGLQTLETASITSPFNMHFTFHQGSSNQKANNNLVTIAQSNGFKIQNDYYTGSQPYWSPNHRLLDTAYAVMKFTIEADQTTIPEVEYVIKGKVLECHNYDGTFVPDKVLGASDAATNFKNGSTCNVEVSTDGSTWITIEDDATPFVDGGTDKVFRVVHNYSYYNSDGLEETRIRLDSIPNLNYSTNGIATYEYVRLKNGSNTWHMLSHNAGTVSTAASFPNLFKTPSSMSTNSSGVLSATFSTADANALKNVHGTGQTAYNVGGTLTGTALAGYTNNVIFGTWNSNTITFRGSFTASETITGVTLSSAGAYDLSSNSTINAITNATAIVGETLTIIETGEQRIVTSFDTTNKYVVLDSPFTQVVTNNNTFTLNGRGKDLRASTNPAIQTLDYITNKRYGKDLNRYTELDLPSFKASALLCDTRSDATLTLTSNQSCVKGDVYKLVDSGSNHIASGQVLANTSSSNTVTFTAVSGKFFRQYFNYVLYKIGDFVTHEDKVYEVTISGYKSTAPTHSSGTANGFKYLSSVTLTRESGTGPSSLSLVTNGTLPSYSLYDSDFIKYWRYLGWESHDQEWVTRHQTNFTLDTSKSIFANINALLSHFNGILTYSNGKYELNVETQVDAPTESISDGVQSNPLHIKNEDIIGNISLVDNTQRNSKNTIKASLSDPQNNWASRSISFFNSDFLKADRNVVKTGSFPFTGITNYYNGRINVEKELIQSRFSKEISFTVGQRGLLLKAGEVISISYSPFNFTNKRFRVENLTFNANCTVSVKAREYDDSIYAVTPQKASIAHAAQTGANPSLEKPGAPTSLSTTNNKPGVITVSWSNASNFSPTSDFTELYRHTSDSRANATLLATISDAVTFNDVVAGAGTFYYWVQHKRNSSLTNTNKTILLTGDYNASAGVSGVAKTLSAQLDVDVSSIQVKFNDSDALTPSGTAQDVKLSATLRNITADSNGVIFTLLDTDQTSQTDVQFTNEAVTLSDTSSPYEATVDASSFSVASTNKFVKVQVTDTSGEVFTELVPVSITKDGSSGSIGVSAAAVKLEPSSHVITYSANDPDSENPSTTVLFTTELQGNTGTSSSAFSGAPFYEFLVDGSTTGSILSSGTRTIDTVAYAFNAFRLPQVSEPADGETVEVQVKVRDGATNGTIKATDSITIFGIKSGSDSTTAFLTNSAHVVSTASDGSGASFTNAGGTFKVFVGSTDKTTNCNYTVQSETGVDVSINAGTGAYTIASMSADIGTAVLRATIPASVSPTGTQFTLDQTYTIAKSKAGTVGAAGTDAKVVTLTADKSAVIYNSSGSSPTPSGNITFTASTKNFTHPRFRFILDGTTGSFSSGNGAQRSGDNIYESDTGVFSIPSSHFTTPKQFTVQVAENGAESTIVAFDSLNVVGIKAATDGDDGADAHTVFNTNSAHTFPAANNGTVANADEPAGATTIQVYRGTTQLTYAASGGAAGTNTYDVSVSTTGITLAASTVSNQRVFTPTAVSASKGTATFTITAGGLTFTSVYTFSKSVKGDAGDDGISVKTVTLFQKSSSTPSYSTTSGTYASPTNSGWSETMPALTANGDKAWAITRTFNSDNSSTSNWTAPVNILTRTNGTNATALTITSVQNDTPSTGRTTITFSDSTSFIVDDGTNGSDGDGVDIIYITASSTPGTPNPSSGAPTGWSFSIPSAPTGNNRIYVSFGVRTNNTGNYTWSAARQLTGIDGADAQNQRQPSIFRKNNNAISSTSGSFSNPLAGNTSWSFSVPAITTNGDKVYVATRIFTSDGNSPQDSSWSTPAVYAERVDGTTVTGQGVRQANLYKKNDTTLTSTTAGSFSNPQTGNTDWSFSVPALTANNDKVYVATRTFTSDGASPQDSAWSTPVIYAQRSDGNDGDSVYVARIYLQRAISQGAVAPTPPSGGTYNFSNDTLSAPTGWTTTEPTFDFTKIIYKSEKVLVGSGTVSITFPESVVHNPFFDNTKLIFKRSATTPAANANSLTSSFTIPSGFSETPPAGSDPLWQVTGIFLYTGTNAYKYDWSAAVKITGDTGTTGQSVKTVDLFKKNDSTFGTTTAGNFASPTSGVESGWTTTQPALTASGDKTYKVTRTFTSDGNSPQDSSWSSPVVVAQREDGNNDPRSGRTFIYHQTSGTVPSNTSTGTPYNFETGALTVPSTPSGWGTSRLSRPYFRSEVTISESSYDGNQNVTYDPSMRVGSIGRKDPGDWVISWNDTNNRLDLAIDGTIVSQPTYPTKLRNDQVDQTFIQGKLTNASAFRTAIQAGTSSFSGSAADLSGNLNPDRLNSSDFPQKGILTAANQTAARTVIGAGTSSFSGLVQDLGGDFLDAGKVPIDDSNFFKRDSGEIKFGDTINYTGYITAGSGTKKAGLVGSGTNADATVRIFAGQSFASRDSAPFRVTQGGEVNVTSFNVNTGTSSTNLRFRPGDASGYFFSVGNSADPSSAPMRARSVSGSSHIELQNVKIFKSDGTTLMFDSAEGFTAAAYTDIASNVGTSDTGSSVSTATITNLINPFTNTTGSTTATTPSSQQVRFTKVTLTSSKVLTFKVIKDGSMDGLALGTGADAAAKAKIPTKIQMRLMHSTNSNLSGATPKAVLGTSFSAGVTRTEGSPSATQYQISKTVDDGTPGFEIVEWDTLNGASDALAASGNFEITDSDTYASGDHYFFVEIDGTGGVVGSGANDRSQNAPRTLEISGSGDFSVDSDGNIQPAGSTRVSADSTFTDNRLIIADGNSRSVESSSGLTYSSSILDVTGAIRATGDITAFHSSDERLKDNITVIDSALAKVKQLRGVEFDWNDKQSLHKGHDIGVIAQDVEQVAPELVKDRDDGYKAVDYPKLVALLIEAVKELELKVKKLEDKQK